jgi:hypothetical protein
MFFMFLSGCSLFLEPQKLAKFESDLAKDAVELIEDIEDPSEPAGDSHASH